jgi:hypothetical protein
MQLDDIWKVTHNTKDAATALIVARFIANGANMDPMNIIATIISMPAISITE